ncbi:MAG: VCBS repeat-containing protein [Acidobacteria bacterium]|nr:VCBS repeat-containing protein [Acidobacteriota bacterium]
MIVLAVVVALAFIVITVVKRIASDADREAVAPGGAEKQRIQSFWAAYNRANTLRTQGDFAGAAAAYREALQLNPAHEDCLYYLGTSLEERGDYAQAVEIFRQLLAINPSSGRALGELGNTLSLLAPGASVDYEQARQAFLQNIQINREQAGPFVRLGMMELDQGHWEAALEKFRVAAGFGSPDGNFWVGYTLFLQKKLSEAVPSFRKVLDTYAHERKITGRGVLSEGDVLPAPGKPLTALEKAGLKSMLFLHWTALRMGGYPAGLPHEFQLRPRTSLETAPLPADARLPLGASGGRAVPIDFDKDGHMDLIVVGPGQPLKLYRREGEKYAEGTEVAGLKGVSDIWTAYATDYDSDGYPDLYLVRSGFLGSGQNLLYHNNRNGTFSNVTAAMGLEGIRATAGACFFDFDGDGRTDLLEVGASDREHSAVRLYRNVGDRFVESTLAAGLSASGTAVDCTAGDFNRDGKADLFVLFWQTGGVLYANQGNGKFADATAQAGLSGIRGRRFNAVFFDYDKDGLPDLLVTGHAPFEEAVRTLLQPEYRPAGNTPRLFHNKGHGSFEEVTAEAGLNRCYGTMQVLPVDVDSDGWTDLLFVNGSQDAQRLEPSVVLRNVKGKKFQEWFYVPGFGSPGNFIGATLVPSARSGPPNVFFAGNPIVGNKLGTSALFFQLQAPQTSATHTRQGSAPKGSPGPALRKP